MAHSQAVALGSDWGSWDGRIVSGKYPLRDCLGEAGGAAIYLTEAGGATAAIKLLPADAPQAREQVASWKLASRLTHPNLVRVIDTGLWHADNEHDLYFAVMEYCDESLAGVLRQRALTADEARVMLSSALDALKYLHRQGIVHGQLSPANILASGDRLKLSTDHVRRCTDPDFAATPGAYEAPEKAAGTTSLSSDAWALGITLCEALTRRLPGRDKEGVPQLPEKLAAPFDEIAKGCLAPEREQRLSIAAIGTLLERPAPELVKPIKLAAIEDAKTEGPEIRVVQTQAAAASDIRIARPAAATPDLSDQRGGFAGNKRPLMIAIAALALLFAILIGVRHSETRPQNSAPVTASVAQTQSATAPGTAHPQNTKLPVSSPGSVAHQVLPETSSRARNSIHGTVKVKVSVAVGEDGKVAAAKLASRGPSAYFARQAVEAARQWTFAPPAQNGKPHRSEWMLRFEFRRSGSNASARQISGS